MDIQSLPSQNTKEYSEIDYDDIMSLYDYHPWEGGNNPKIDRLTHTLLNMKNSDQKRWQPAVNYFTKVLTNPRKGIARLADSGPNLFCIVPSHTHNNVSPSLVALADAVSKNFHFSNSENLLRRVYDVPKAATGGPRNQQLHIDSIKVTDESAVLGETVFLFDDVTTTGSSLHACKQLLLDAGAHRVAMIALGQTYMDQ